MDQWKSVDEVLDFAIQGEQEAVEFYTHLADRMERPSMAKIFSDFAQEERGHKKKLENVKAGGTLKPAEKKVVDLKIADYLVDVKPTQDMDYQEALVLAMKKEKKAYQMYTDLAATVDDESLRETFLALAQEEAKHKLRFEVEYDDVIMQEN